MVVKVRSVMVSVRIFEVVKVVNFVRMVNGCDGKRGKLFKM